MQREQQNQKRRPANNSYSLLHISTCRLNITYLKRLNYQRVGRVEPPAVFLTHNTLSNCHVYDFYHNFQPTPTAKEFKPHQLFLHNSNAVSLTLSTSRYRCLLLNYVKDVLAIVITN